MGDSAGVLVETVGDEESSRAVQRISRLSFVLGQGSPELLMVLGPAGLILIDTSYRRIRNLGTFLATSSEYMTTRRTGN